MQQFKTQVIRGRKLIQLNGSIDSNNLNYADFIKAHRLPRRSKLQSLADKLFYTGDELQSNILFAVILITVQIFNLVCYSTNCLYQIAAIVSLCYALVFSLVINEGKKIVIQLICLGGCIALVVMALLSEFIDSYPTFGLLGSVSMVLLAKIINLWLQTTYSQSTNAGFQLEGNLILMVGVGWIGFQIGLNYYGCYTYSYSCWLPFIFALALINTIKVYSLFDYEILHIINLLQQKNQTKSSQQNTFQFTQSINVFIDSGKVYPQMEEDKIQQDFNSQGGDKQTKMANYQSNLEGVDQSQVELKQQNNSNTAQQLYQSSARNITTAIFGISSIGFAVYIIARKWQLDQSIYQSSLYWFLIASLRTTFLLMNCQFQKIVQSHKKDSLSYFFIFSCDALWIAFSVFLMLYSSTISLSTQSTIALSISPLLAIRLFNELNLLSHQTLNNSRYYTFVLFFMLPLQLRQIPAFQGFTIGSWIVDGLIVLFLGWYLQIWSNKDWMMAVIKQFRITIKSRKYKLKLFDKLKAVHLDYQTIMQGNIYRHVILLNCFYYFISLTSDLQIIYLTLYCAPLLLYLSSLINSSKYIQQPPTIYKPSLINILALLLAIGYAVIAYIGVMSNTAHINWSLCILMNIFLFAVILQGEKLAVVYMHNYMHLVRSLIMIVFFVLVYLPFVAAFMAGYFLTDFSPQFLYYYSLSGFFYIWLLLTLVGVSVHWVLNLTARSKKDLFIAQYMQGEMHNINMKENVEKILMISNKYQMLNERSEDLLNYLKSEKHMMVVVRKEKDIEHDYQLVEPDDPIAKQRLQVQAKVLNPLDLLNIFRPIINDPSQLKPLQNPVLSFFQDKERNQIKFTVSADYNSNQPQLKRMAENSVSVTRDQHQIQCTKQFKQAQRATDQQVGEMMSRLYTFLSKPSNCLSRQTFSSFVQLISGGELSTAQTQKLYDRFSAQGLMSEYRFKTFITDYVSYRYDMKDDILSSQLRTFYCRQIVPILISKKFDQFRYFLQRKKIETEKKSLQVWLIGNYKEENMQEYAMLKQKQLKKKAQLLQRKKNKSGEKHDNEGQQDKQANVGFQRLGKRRRSTFKKKQRQLKDKKFMSTDSIYSVLVNSLIECYIYYQKQSQNFKMKSIKLSLSNLLALLTKASDIIFVFGYSTVYLLIAYFQQNYEDSSYILSSISYPLLLALSSSLVIVYIILIVYHKKDFETGTLGLDDNLRSLNFRSLKFYTTTILFLLGSGLANYIISISLNSFLCSSESTLYNFADTSCFQRMHYGYMLSSLLILVIYWPLSAMTFPFSTAMDRSLQIKYKSEYEILYLQFKFLINGYNSLLNPFDFQQQHLINSLLKIVVCCSLSILYHRMQPCSYEWLNMIQGKIYILLTILSFAGALCYFVGLLYASIITGSLMVLYLCYFIYVTVKNYASMKQDNDQNEILQDNLKNQNIKIQIIRENQQNKDKTITTTSGLELGTKSFGFQKSKPKNLLQVIFSKPQSQINNELQDTEIKLNKGFNKEQIISQSRFGSTIPSHSSNNKSLE